MPARGPLDVLFDPGGAEGAGKAISDLTGTDQVRYLEMMADGRIVAGGRSGTDYAAARYMPDGSLDPLFSPGGAEGNGRAKIPTPGADTVYGMALQPDGKVLLAGGSNNAGDEDIMIMRLDTAGALDPTFGVGGADGNGVYTLSRPGTNDSAYGIKVDPSGDIYIVGLWTGASDILVMRLESDGTIDPNFSPGGADGNGILILDTGSNEYTYAMTLAASGGVFLAAQRGGVDIVVAKINAAGVLEPTFGVGGADGNGVVTFGSAEAEAPRGILELADGTIAVSGNATVTNDDGRIWKLSAVGVLDPTFGVGGADGNGVATYDFTGGNDMLRTIREQPDGKLVMVGHSGNGVDDDVAVLRVLADGTPDPEFALTGAGGNGRARVDFGSNEQGYGLVIADDGALVVGSGTNNNFAVARFGSEGIANFTGTWATGANTFGACLADTSQGTANWTEIGVGNCTTATAGAWNRVAPATTDTDADVVSYTGFISGATVDLRFGMRTASSQTPGRYVAPITFTFVGA